jgi:hypothetical protein
MAEKNCKKCGWDSFTVEIHDSDASTYLKCTKCGELHKIEAKAEKGPAIGRPAHPAVDAICRDFDADRLLLKKSGSENPLDFPRP